MRALTCYNAISIFCRAHQLFCYSMLSNLTHCFQSTEPASIVRHHIVSYRIARTQGIRARIYVLRVPHIINRKVTKWTYSSLTENAVKLSQLGVEKYAHDATNF